MSKKIDTTNIDNLTSRLKGEKPEQDDLDEYLINLENFEAEEDEKSTKLTEIGKITKKMHDKKIKRYTIALCVVAVLLLSILLQFAWNSLTKYAEGDTLNETEANELGYNPNIISKEDIESYEGDGDEFPEGVEVIEIKDSTISRDEIFADESKAIQTVLELIEEQDYEEANRIALSIQSEAGISLQNDVNLILNIEDPNYYIQAGEMLPMFLNEDVVIRYFLNNQNNSELIYLKADSEVIVTQDKPMIYEKHEIESHEVPLLVQNFTSRDLKTTKFFRYELYTSEYYPMYDLYIAISSIGETKIYLGKYKIGDDGEYHRQDGTVTPFIPTKYPDLEI